MKRDNCSADENIVRAIRTSDWDEKNQRWSSSLFKNQATSVSRTKKLSLIKILKIFCKELHNPPVHKVIKTGEITVRELVFIGHSYLENNKSRKIDIWVEKAPTNENPAHAEIFAAEVKKLPRSLALNISAELKLREVLPCNVLNVWVIGNLVACIYGFFCEIPLKVCKRKV